MLEKRFPKKIRLNNPHFDMSQNQLILLFLIPQKYSDNCLIDTPILNENLLLLFGLQIDTTEFDDNLPPIMFFFELLPPKP